ncbi:hypothetical protein RB200_28585 [Streptomyces sp. PmtG]
MVDFLRVTSSPDPSAIPAFLERHPEAATALGLAEQTRPAAGFTGLTYHSVHAFGLVDAAESTRWARLALLPRVTAEPLPPEEAGGLTLTRAETPAAEPDFDPPRLPRGVLAPQDRLAADRSRVYAAARHRRG